MGDLTPQYAGAACYLTNRKRMGSSMRSLYIQRQQGTVLAVVLVVLVVMMLGSVSLMRSIDTSALLSGNIGFKRDSLNSSAAGLNKAFEKMKLATFVGTQDSVAGCPPPAGTGTACTAVSTWKTLNFYPRLLESDASGIPVILKDTAAFDGKFTAGTVVANGNQVRFLIERMCNAYGPSSKANCVLSAYSPKGGEQFSEKAGSVATPVYRVTVRTDGARNTQTYAQWNVTFRQE
jgi:type IV pilus assembly protein PilX